MMKDEILKKRVDECVEVEMQFSPKENSFYGKFDYNSDFNVHYTELLCSTDEEWEKIITGLRTELNRRQVEKGIIEPDPQPEPPKDPRKNVKKILIASTGTELGSAKEKILGAIGSREALKQKLMDKFGEDIDFVDMANLPEGMTVEGLSKEELIQIKDSINLKAVPPKELQSLRDGAYFFEDGLTKKERNAVIVPVRTEPKYQRNEPCPCGSGKKYKNCCLKNSK